MAEERRRGETQRRKWLFGLLSADWTCRAKFQHVVARVVPVFLIFFQFWQNDRIRFYDLDEELFVRLGIIAMFGLVKVERVRDLVKNQLVLGPEAGASYGTQVASLVVERAPFLGSFGSDDLGWCSTSRWCQ